MVFKRPSCGARHKMFGIASWEALLERQNFPSLPLGLFSQHVPMQEACRSKYIHLDRQASVERVV